MCGRFTLDTSNSQLLLLFGQLDLGDVQPGSQPAANIPPRYNIAPSQLVHAVRIHPISKKRQMVQLKWGLLPQWAKDPKIAYQLINARAETAAQKPAFRAAARYRRCLIPATGFFEWQKQGKIKQPYLMRPFARDHELFAMAGLWERWQSPEGTAVETCSILTVDANASIAPIHGRMPLIISSAHMETWLDPRHNSPQFLPKLLSELGHGSGAIMAAQESPPNTTISKSNTNAWKPVAVSTRVNSPRFDDAECIVPVVQTANAHATAKTTPARLF